MNEMSEMEWLYEFSNNLARMMYESKLTQRDLADMTGLSEPTISKYLNRQQMPGVKAVLNMAYAFGCNTDDLIDFGCCIK